MTSPEDEIKDLREKNNELVQKVQYWKMTAAQRENEKLELMKEINELRLKLSVSVFRAHTLLMLSVSVLSITLQVKF